MLDTDTIFINEVSQELLFDKSNGDKPYILAAAGTQQNRYWEDVPSHTYYALNKPEVVKCMTFFPIVIKKEHFQPNARLPTKATSRVWHV